MGIFKRSPRSGKSIVLQLHAEGLTQTEISDRTGVPRSTLKRWIEQSRVKPVENPTPKPYRVGYKWPAAYRRGQG